MDILDWAPRNDEAHPYATWWYSGRKIVNVTLLSFCVLRDVDMLTEGERGIEPVFTRNRPYKAARGCFHYWVHSFGSNLFTSSLNLGIFKRLKWWSNCSFTIQKWTLFVLRWQVDPSALHGTFVLKLFNGTLFIQVVRIVQAPDGYYFVIKHYLHFWL